MQSIDICSTRGVLQPSVVLIRNETLRNNIFDRHLYIILENGFYVVSQAEQDLWAIPPVHIHLKK